MALRRNTTNETNSIEVGKDDILWIKEKLTSLDKKITEVENTLTKLNITVIGDSVYGQKGLVERIEEIEAYIVDDKSHKAKIIGGGLVLFTIWTIILEFKDKIFH